MKAQFRYAGFGIRFIAYTVDAILSLAFSFILSRVLYSTTLSLLKAEVWNLIIGLTIYSIYEIFLTYKYGGTVGKILMKCPVVDENGKHITLVQSIIRYFSKWLSTIILGIGYLMIIWTPKKQGLHDKIAKTYVVMDYNIRVNEKLRKSLIVVLPIIVIVAIIFYLTYLTSLVILVLQIPSAEFNADKPVGSLDNYCGKKPFWIKGDCIIQLIQSEPIFKVMDTQSRLDICSGIKTKGKHSQCILDIALSKNNATICRYSKSNYLDKKCSEEYNLVKKVVDYSEEIFNKPFSGELGRGKISLGVYVSEKCVLRNQTEFYSDQTICFVFNGFLGFVKGNDGLHWYDFDNRIIDSNGNIVGSTTNILNFKGKRLLENNTMNNVLLTAKIMSLGVGNFTYETRIYDRISNKGLVMNTTINIVGEKPLLHMEDIIFGVEMGDKCVRVPDNIFDKLDGICIKPVKITGFERAPNGLHNIKIDSKTINKNGTVIAFVQYDFDDYDKKYTLLKNDMLDGRKFTFFYNIDEGHYTEETVITDEVSGKTVDVKNEFTISKEPKEKLIVSRAKLGKHSNG